MVRWAGGRDHLGASHHCERDKHAAGDSAAAVDEHHIVSVYAQGLVDHLRGGERRDRERRRDVPRDSVRFSRQQRRRRDQRWRPRSLVPQRQGMGENLVPFLPVPDCLANRGYDPGRRDAERHRRCAADIPLARANELVPVGDPRGPHLDQDLIAGQRARIGEVDRLDGGAELLDPGGEHS